ncbi:MFS transporter [Glycomyces dulcitolivorans]|uniref:MFS transporter n=1 Tax=Glycomyces dulcitolivorans TaxID=2200759 RepID=UPI000DD37DE3|nr:MFS transporter [Glycomyces dulcitolivorans]
MLVLGWSASCVGWGTAVGSIGNYQADRLPEHQRGKVSGATSMTMHVALVIGILLAPEEDTRDAPDPGRLPLRRLVASYGFRPREVPDFAWNWLGRFVFFLGLSLTTGFATFFFAQRLGIAVADLAPFIALTSVLGIGGAVLGSLGAGWLSDRLRRRRGLVLAGAAVYAAGNLVLAFAWDAEVIIAGMLVSLLGVAVFTTVGQAVVLDVLPHRETEAGATWRSPRSRRRSPA